MMLALTDWILSTYVLLATHLLLLQQRCICEGVLHCVCTTAECRRERTSSCQAQVMCYEQRMSGGAGEGQASRSPGDLKGVIRGCIDSSTPLLCRNQKPNWFSGSWPLLRCCAEDWCNRGSATETASGNGQNEDADDNDEYDDEYISVETSADDRGQRLSVADHPKKTSPPSEGHRQRTLHPCSPSSTDPLPRDCPDDPKSTQSRLNLLFVLVPVSGACALLAICASAFVILKRGESQRHRTADSNPSDVYDYVKCGRLNVLEGDGLQGDLEKDAFGCHRNYKRSPFSDARKNCNDPHRTSQTYIESRIFAA